MAIYQVTDNEIKTISRTTFSQSGLKEREDLQRLLKHQIEVISPETLVVAEEFGEWDESRRRIDLLGIDKQANIVVIELKRTEDGGHMELQAVRYAAMVSTLTFDRLVDIYADYIKQNELGLDAQASILEFLGWDDKEEDEFAQEVKIVLASAEFSRELTTTVMWLNDYGLSIRCVRMHPYESEGKLLLDVQSVIPIPEVEDYQVKIREKRQKERASRSGGRDTSRYSISFNQELVYSQIRKSDIGYCTVQLLNEKDLINQRVFEFLRADNTCAFQLLKLESEVTETNKKYNKYRVSREPELIYDGQEYYVARNWGKESAQAFANKISARFPEITYSQHSD
ncbi:hypothetical protein GCM10007938_18740 [Vibrio zhanjiangensis]|uniref:DUF91 domain-containing protein n=1 Tax=Vibrio zhanjiangensis TaxID=1046128 RepID=A0ABQ6EYI6_9VIBR|nr:hypothetical protein [Vibrio zhanjiangensis]GLT18096.1 hypothetical protein GCM10007938_18740 [Vibrio zhanjiangensis]